MPALLAALISSYLIGSFPTAYLLVKWLKRVDVRTIGSGNVGATNVSRIAGFKAGLVVFLIDAGKGFIASRLIAPWLLEPATTTEALLCGLLAVLGHNFPVFLKFQGGKGVATTIGVLIGTMPLVACIYIFVWVLCFFLWHYASVASIAAAAAIPLAQMPTRDEKSSILLGSCLALLIIIRHRANIERLVQGTEPRVGKTRE